MPPIPDISQAAGIWYARNILIPFTRAVLGEFESELSSEVAGTIKNTVPEWIGKALFR